MNLSKTLCARGLLAALGATALCTGALASENTPNIPLYQLRFSATITGSEVWPDVLAAFDRHPGLFDEVWFSTGVTYPDMAWHVRKAAEQARAAEDLRKRGIAPSLQVQVTMGHGFTTTNEADWIAKTWRGFTGVGGGVCQGGSCPRDERFLEYISASTALYASYRPPWVWIDDDLRIMGHGPAAPWNYSGSPHTFGCWCDGCLHDFSAKEGKTWTREALAAAVTNDVALADRWETFAFESIALVAQRIIERFHALSPETHFGYQHCAHFNDKQRIVFKAMYEASGRQSVGDRPGGSWYQDHDPYGQIMKSYREAREIADLGDMPEIVISTPEMETYPRVFSSRTGRGLMIESLAALTMGMNALSMYFMDAGRSGEAVSFYERRFFTQLETNLASLRAFLKHTAGALPAGLKSNRSYPVFDHGTMQAGTPDRMEVTTGVPIAYGKAHYLGTLDMEGVSAWSISSPKLMALYERADKAAGGRLPVLPMAPLQGWLMPRTLADGTLKSVTFINTTLDESWPTRLRLRGVKPGTKAAVWRALDGTVESCAVTFEGVDAFVTLPAVSAWNGGWLAL